MPNRSQHTKGFTLVEVLVALGIVAIAMSAAIMAAGNAADTALHLRQRTLATWIAADRITELRLQGIAPSPGSRSSGETTRAGQVWRWRQQAHATPDAGLVRVEVSVAPAGDETKELTRLQAFLGRNRAALQGTRQ